MNAAADAQALLDALEGMQMPPPVSWWPLAWGWWVLALALGLGLFGLAHWMLDRRRRRRWRALVHARLADIERNAATATVPADRVMSDLSVLLRQIALVQLPRAEVARLHGKPWLEQLDRLSGTNQFSAGPGQLLVDAPYRNAPVAQSDIESVIALTRRLLKRVGDPRELQPSSAALGGGRA